MTTNRTMNVSTSVARVSRAAASLIASATRTDANGDYSSLCWRGNGLMFDDDSHRHCWRSHAAVDWANADGRTTTGTSKVSSWAE